MIHYIIAIGILSSVSWSQFLIVLVIGLLFYYLWVFVYAYAGDFRKVVAGNSIKSITEFPLQENNFNASPELESFNQAQKLANEIKQILSSAASKKCVKEEVYYQLQLKLQEYSPLRGTAFQYAINNLIEKEGFDQCSISFSEVEMKMMWEK